ncbi:MAG: divalent-cation tolerance protein CutA [Dehalococcoidia bacterium]|nr:divalent-cation tolerance protein CutA [Dehalococcoidia bacterium]
MTDGSGKVVVFVTASSEEEADRIAHLLLEKRKAACINVIPGIKSRFWWQGKLDSAQESLLVIKTRANLVPELTEIVKKAHSYSVPEVVAVPIVDGNRDYLDWVDTETR